MFADIKLEDLNLNFAKPDNLRAFGPASSISERIINEFDGKIFKPYNKKEKLGKLCEFTLVPTGTGSMQAPMTHQS